MRPSCASGRSGWRWNTATSKRPVVHSTTTELAPSLLRRTTAKHGACTPSVSGSIVGMAVIESIAGLSAMQAFARAIRAKGSPAGKTPSAVLRISWDPPSISSDARNWFSGFSLCAKSSTGAWDYRAKQSAGAKLAAKIEALLNLAIDSGSWSMRQMWTTGADRARRPQEPAQRVEWWWVDATEGTVLLRVCDGQECDPACVKSSSQKQVAELEFGCANG